MLAYYGGGVSCNMNPTAPSEHTVTFDTDGGSAVDPVQVKDGETVSIPETTKEGYDFVSWYNGDVEYDFSSAVTSDITLTAKWKEHEYKITYELNGGKNNEKNPATYTINTDDFTIIEPVSGSAETPNFLGWYSDKDLTKPAELTIKKGSKGDLTFYAKWTNEKVYTVTFKYTGVENTAEPKTAKVKDGDALSADQIAQVKAGLPDETEYVAMYTDEACTKEFNQETKIAADTTIYVKVKQVVRHAVTVNWVGTESSAASLNVKDGETVKEDSIKNVIPKGYGYVGTYSDKDCTTVFDFATKITADTVLYVKVNQIVKYTVTFNSNGGSEVKAATVVKGEKVTKPTDPTREGYAFKGWFNGETEYDFESAATTNITLVAKWEVEIPEQFEIDKSYSFIQVYNMIENGEYGATAEQIIWNIDISTVTELKEKDQFVVTCNISGIPENGSLGYQSEIDNWTWHSLTAKEDGSKYTFTFERGSEKTIEGTLAGFKFVPQHADKQLIGTKISLEITDLTVEYIPFIPGAENTENIWSGKAFKPYDDKFAASNLQSIYDKSNGSAKMIITYTLNDYTPEYDYDGVGTLTGWDVVDEVWTNTTADMNAFGLNTGCSKDNYVAGTVITKEFELKDILDSGVYMFTFNIYNNKITITSVDVKYTAK